MVASQSKPSRRNPNLERDKMITVALALLNEVGFEGLTQRKLADKLGVKAAALYWHFENKQELIDLLATRIVAEEAERSSLPESPTWRDVFTVYAHASRRALRRYRDGALVIARADMSKFDNLPGREKVMRYLFDLDFPPKLALSVFFAIERYALGCVLEEQADPHTSEQRARMMRESLPQLAEGYPAVARGYREGNTDDSLYDFDYQFETGLALLLDGIEAQIKPRVKR